MSELRFSHPHHKQKNHIFKMTNIIIRYTAKEKAIKQLIEQQQEQQSIRDSKEILNKLGVEVL